ncbi:MAG: hypothetical protein JSS07_12780 [Proteobacteria bacterium]|nr:hypothetical protein [Pseudomonadota bacterium]
MLGEMAVGKSSLVLQFVKGHFDPKHETTIGGLISCKHLSNLKRPI